MNWKVYIIIIVILTHTLSANETDLVAFWSFEDSTAGDFSGNGYNGQFKNSPTPAIGHNGTGTSIRLEGEGVNTDQGDHVLLPKIRFEDYDEFTISLWVKEESVTHHAGEAYIFFGDHNSGWLGLHHHIIHPDVGQTERVLQVSVGSIIGKIDYLAVEFPDSYFNKWKFYTITYDGDKLNFYIDGEFKGSHEQKVLIGTANAGLARHWWQGGYTTATRFTGWIDDVKIYKRALTEEEIVDEFGGCDSRSFVFSDQNHDFNYIASAEILDNKVIMTESEVHQVGALHYKDHLPLYYGFTAEFSFMIRDGKGYTPVKEEVVGADGFAFVIQTQSANFIGSRGGFIGFSGIDNALAVEIDLYPNKGEPFYDQNENHLAVFGSKNNFHNYHDSDAEIAFTPDIVQIQHDVQYYCKIEYKPTNKTLKIWLDDKPSGELVLQIDDFELEDYIDLIDDRSAFVGLTASTGNANQTHEIHQFDLCIVPNNFISSVEHTNQNIENLEIFPQPIQNELNIKIPNGFVDEVTVQIYDVIGKECFNGVFDSTKDIRVETDALQTGTYLIRLTSHNKVHTQKFIKIK